MKSHKGRAELRDGVLPGTKGDSYIREMTGVGDQDREKKSIVKRGPQAGDQAISPTCTLSDICHAQL